MRKPIDPTVIALVDLLDDDLNELFHERAAVREFDGGHSRVHAEALGLLDVVNRYPEALSGVMVFAIELEGAIHWVVTTDRDYARSALVRRSTRDTQKRCLAEVVRNTFGGTALLALSHFRDDV